jgi:hypothetical protein
MPAPGPRARRAVVAVALATLLIALPGCSSDGRKKVYPVRGQILVDGKPAFEATVMFQPVDNAAPDRVNPTGMTDADGRFAISSYVKGDGAPPGDYIVLIEWRERSGVLKSNFDGPDRLKGKYYDEKKPPFRVTVEKQPLELPPFELKKP